jgi:hypothetical protein
MHDIVVNELESHFSGDAPQSFYDHLEHCAECRAEIAAMEEVSLIFQDFRIDPEAAPAPPLGFYNRVVADIVEKQKKEAWGLFSPGAAFFRRVAFASLLVLASLGSFLVTRESSEGGTDAASIMAERRPEQTSAEQIPAEQKPADRSQTADRDRILLTLASYGQ